MKEATWTIATLVFLGTMTSGSLGQEPPPGQRKAGDKKTLSLPGGVKMEFAWCPPRTFLMGSPEGEKNRNKDETQHEVHLTKGFWLGVHEVTQAQWKAVMGNNLSEFRGDDLPVDQVSWEDAQKFCAELKEKTGLEVRLPTEAEWEYACRAGRKAAYGFGEDARDLGDYAWFIDNSNGQTQPVGKKKPNRWGIFDMHGNVWEWCSDWYEDYPREKATDPTGPPRGSDRVIRGGSWLNFAGRCRVAYRSRGAPGDRCDYLGFRLAAGPSGVK